MPKRAFVWPIYRPIVTIVVPIDGRFSLFKPDRRQ